MKLEELKVLASELKLGDVLVKSEDVILSIDGRGDLKKTFPVPNCSKCLEKCCPSGVAVSLFDIPRLADRGLDKFLAGRFEGYVELFLADDGGESVKLSRPYMAPETSESKYCVFLNEERRCSIYEDRPLICRAYPVAVRIDEDRNRLALWLGGCQNYEISTDEAAFRRLLSSAIQDYNEKVTANALLMHSRNKLRECGFGKYMEDEWQILIDRHKKGKEMQKQISDLQQVVDRLRAPQDYTSIIQRLQSENDWLKERMVALENEMAQQRERAHSIISDLTRQLSSEHSKLVESFLRQNGKQEKRHFWKR